MFKISQFLRIFENSSIKKVILSFAKLQRLKVSTIFRSIIARSVALLVVS